MRNDINRIKKAIAKQLDTQGGRTSIGYRLLGDRAWINMVTKIQLAEDTNTDNLVDVEQLKAQRKHHEIGKILVDVIGKETIFSRESRLLARVELDYRDFADGRKLPFIMSSTAKNAEQ